MPLPTRDTEWPPQPLADIHSAMTVWDAWWTGDPRDLATAYGATAGVNAASQIVHPTQFAGGVIGAVARFFWGRPSLEAGQPAHKLHVPVASDICRASADLLFAEAPTFTMPDDEGGKKAQDRLDELMDDGTITRLAEAAELGAALGGSYLRVTWDEAVERRPFATVVHADAAWPEFRWGRLVAVTFWHVVARDGAKVVRHLERHETDSRGVGVILHGLYEGTDDRLGHPVPLTESPATAGITVDENSMISSESLGLAVRYIPNATPNPLWRKDPIGKDLGRSDLSGIEGLMDALDETYTSWMRDIRLGKARVFVPQELLKDLGPGQGAMFNPDQEIFSPIGSGVGSLNPAAKSGAASGFLQAEQFAIRFAEHENTAKNLKEQILRTAGYSSQTFGEGEFGNDVTATEVTVKQQRSFTTRDRKIRAWRPELAAFAEKLLAVDSAIFRSGVTAARPDVQFADGVQDSVLTLAQTAQALDAAGAASRETLVRLVHPDWDDDAVMTEVRAIAAQEAAANPPMLDPAGGFAPDEVSAGDNAAG